MEFDSFFDDKNLLISTYFDGINTYLFLYTENNDSINQILELIKNANSFEKNSPQFIDKHFVVFSKQANRKGSIDLFDFVYTREPSFPKAFSFLLKFPLVVNTDENKSFLSVFVPIKEDFGKENNLFVKDGDDIYFEHDLSNVAGRQNPEKLNLNRECFFFSISLFYDCVFVDSVESYLNEVNFLYLFQLKELANETISKSALKMKQINAKVRRVPENGKRRAHFYLSQLTNEQKKIKLLIHKIDVCIRKKHVTFSGLQNLRSDFDKYTQYLNYFSLSSYYDEASLPTNEFSVLERDDVIFYRGVFSNSYKELAKVFRKTSYLENECDRYREYLRFFPQQFSSLNRIDCLTQMQHHDLPTRMLDVSLNPLVALYMSCTSEYSQMKTDEAEPLTSPFGEVIGYLPKHNNDDDQSKYYDSIRVTMMACLPLIDNAEKIALFKLLRYRVKAYRTEEKVKSFLLKKSLNVKSQNPAHRSNASLILSNAFSGYHKLIRLAKEECQPFDPKEFNPFDLLNAYYVKVGMVNERIVAQSGCFIICGLDEDAISTKLTSTRNDHTFHRIFITNKKMILKELRLLNISQSTMTPDMDHVAKAISK